MLAESKSLPWKCAGVPPGQYVVGDGRTTPTSSALRQDIVVTRYGITPGSAISRFCFEGVLPGEGHKQFRAGPDQEALANTFLSRALYHLCRGLPIIAKDLGGTKVGKPLDSRVPPVQQVKESTRTILLVEDHFETRWCAAEYLRQFGYRVLEAVNAGEAFDLVKSGIDIDFVFSDVNMPGGEDGYFLAAWLAQHRPTLPVLLTSGDAEDPKAMHASPLRRFIRKPYEPARVHQIVQLMLDGRGK